MTKIVDKCINGIVAFGLFAVPICFIFVLFYYNSYYKDVFEFRELPWIIAGMAFYGLIFYCAYLNDKLLKKYKSYVIAISLILLNGVMLFVLFDFHAEPVSDYKAIWDTANKMAIGKFNIHELDYDDYMRIYNWQLGISLFESWVIDAFGANYDVLRVLNLIIINCTCLLTYRMVVAQMGEKAGILSIMLFSTYYPMLSTVGQFSNQHLACLIILIILFLLARKSWLSWALAGLGVASLNFIRPMGIILILTAGCYLCYEMFLKNRGAGEMRNLLVRGALFCIGYFLAMSCINNYMISNDYAAGPIDKASMPYFKFHKGLVGYNSPEVGKFSSLDEFNEWEKTALLNELENRPTEVAVYVVNKMIRYLGEFDYKVENSYNHDVSNWNQGYVKKMILFGWGEYVVLAIMGWLCCYGFLISSSGRTELLEITPYKIFFIGNLLVYIFIEAFSSYRYESYPYMFLFATMFLFKK